VFIIIPTFIIIRKFSSLCVGFSELWSCESGVPSCCKLFVEKKPCVSKFGLSTSALLPRSFVNVVKWQSPTPVSSIPNFALISWCWPQNSSSEGIHELDNHKIEAI